MADRIEVDMIVDAIARGFDKVTADVNKVGAASRKAGDEMSNVSKGAKSGSVGMADMALKAAALGVAFGGLAVSAKAVWSAIGEGADIVRARQQLDNLAESIGSTSDAIVSKMTAATGGLVSQAEIVAGAGQIISLGLADTEESVVRLGRLVSELGWDMSQVILTFANNSKMRLDSLGLSVTDVEERIDKLRAAGMSADAAFDLAVIEAGEDKLRLLGSAADTTAGQMQILETALLDIKNRLLELAAVNIAPFLANFTGASSGDLRQQLNDLIDLAGTTGGRMNRRSAGRALSSAFNNTYLDPFGNIDVYIPMIERLVDLINDTTVGAEKARQEIGMALTGQAYEVAIDYWESIQQNIRGASALVEGFTGSFQVVQRSMGEGSGWSLAPMMDAMARGVGAGMFEEALLIPEVEAAAQAAAEAFADAFGQSLASEEPLDIAGLLLDTGVDMGLGLEQLMLLGENAGFAGEKLVQAARDATLFQAAMKMMGDLGADATEEEIQGVIAALDLLERKLQGIDVRATPLLEHTGPLLDGVDDVFSRTSLGVLQEIEQPLANIASYLGEIGQTHSTMITTNALEVAEQEVTPLGAALDEVVKDRHMGIRIEVLWENAGPGLIEAIGNEMARQGLMP